MDEDEHESAVPDFVPARIRRGQAAGADWHRQLSGQREQLRVDSVRLGMASSLSSLINLPVSPIEKAA